MIARLLKWTQRRLLRLLLATYVLGAVLPSVGLRRRGAQVVTLRLPGAPRPISLPMLMLGCLLVVAGLGTEFEVFRHVARRPGPLALGLLANTVYPIAFAALASLALLAWHDADEAQNILVGLAMIGAMPIAGSSTAWSQNAGGNLALSLGLVIVSTLLSPVLTPLGLLRGKPIDLGEARTRGVARLCLTTTRTRRRLVSLLASASAGQIANWRATFRDTLSTPLSSLALPRRSVTGPDRELASHS